ncbi:MAG: hypothetical protein HZLCBSQH_002057 [Candidatus Fervidibacterota bacterium]
MDELKGWIVSNPIEVTMEQNLGLVKRFGAQR